MVEVYDALVREYEGVAGKGGLKIVLAGHSLGTWIVSQVSCYSASSEDLQAIIY